MENIKKKLLRECQLKWENEGWRLPKIIDYIIDSALSDQKAKITEMIHQLPLETVGDSAATANQIIKEIEDFK